VLLSLLHSRENNSNLLKCWRAGKQQPVFVEINKTYSASSQGILLGLQTGQMIQLV
jgi:hypothetical protein